MFYDMFSRTKMNIELSDNEVGTYASKDERKALKCAKEAERAFRRSKGIKPDSFWQRLKTGFKIQKDMPENEDK